LQANIDWQQFAGEEIRVMYSIHPYQDTVEPLIPEFEALTGIKVNFEKYPEQEYYDKLTVEMTGNAAAAPDVYMINNARLGSFEAGGWITDLSEYVTNTDLTDPEWYDYDDIYASGLESGSLSGKLYGMPITGEWQVLFYRKDLYEEKGLSVPKTMDELYENSVALNGDGFAGIANRLSRSGTPWWPWSGFVGAYGCTWLNPETNEPQLNDPKTIAATEMYVKLLQDAGPAGVTNYDWSECVTDFQQGRAGHFLDSSVFMAQFENMDESQVKGKVGYAAMPIGDPSQTNQYTSVNYWLQGMNGQSSHKDAAWLYIQWATCKQTALRVAIDQGTSARASIWENEEFLTIVPEDFAQACAAGAETGTIDTIPNVPQQAEIAEKVNITLNDIYAGTPAADAMEKCQTDTAAILAK
jgi:multiple sugar transport system substrate-binding protein